MLDDLLRLRVLAVRAAFERQQREPDAGIEEFCRRFPATSPIRARETWDLLAPFVFTGCPVGSMDDGRWAETLAWLAGVHGLAVPPPSMVYRQT
jgi:hypothetical protein